MIESGSTAEVNVDRKLLKQTEGMKQRAVKLGDSGTGRATVTDFVTTTW